jgi:hypothetical protein
MRTFLRIRKTLFVLSLLLLLEGCVNPVSRPQTSVKAPPLPEEPATAEKPDTLSYGMVTGRIRKNATTQQELLDLFGGPSTMTTDKDGSEVWMYDRTTTTSSGSYASSTASARSTALAAMASFFGLSNPIDSAAGGALTRSESASAGQGTSTISRSVRSITFIVSFNPDKTVKDYSVRQVAY